LVVPLDVVMREYPNLAMLITETAPSGKRIRASLEGGNGIPGARLEERGEHIRIK
jgi:hypothetical protein